MKLTFDDKNVHKVALGKLALGDCFMTSTVDDDVYMRIDPVGTNNGFFNALYLNNFHLKMFDTDEEVIPVRAELTVFTR